MKILYVVQAYDPSRGGVQWMVQQLAERMVAGYGDTVTVFTTTAYSCQLFTDARQPTLPVGATTLNGVTVRRFPVFNRLTWLRLNAARVAYKLRLPGQDWLRCLYFGPIVPGLADAVAESEAEVIVASSFPMQHMYAALRGGQQAGVPVIFIGTVHPTDPWGYDLPRMYRAIRAAQGYAALSEYERAYLTAHGVPASHIRTIGAGVDVSAFDNDITRAAGADWRTRLGWGDDPVVATVGRQTAYKRVDVVLAAMRQVWAQIPAARLLIAGARTGYTAQLEAEIAALPPVQRAQVTLLPDFDEADKPALYAACDVLVQPSERESFGIVFLEAWAAGKPVIGPRSGAAPTVIDEERDGLLAVYGDSDDWARALLRLLGNATFRAEMGARGREKVYAQYTWDVITRQFRDLYVDVRGVP